MPSDPNAPAPRVEVITSVQRRRRWPTAEKIRLVEETMQPGMSVCYVARHPRRPQFAVQLAPANA
jgi:transposase